MNAKPRYQQIKDHILTRIDDGALGVDDQAPSEAQIVKAFGVSRMTANRALNELASDGVLVRIAGAGTFVADRRTHGEMLALRDIAEELADQGYVHSMEVLSHGPFAASRAAAAAFEIKPGARLIRARVKHCRDGEPVLLEDRLVNAALIPEYASVDLTAKTSYAYLTRLAPLQEVEHVVRAIAAPAKIAKHLSLSAGEPCLLVRRRTWSRGAVASLADLYHAGERFEISGRFKP